MISPTTIGSEWASPKHPAAACAVIYLTRHSMHCSNAQRWKQFEAKRSKRLIFTMSAICQHSRTQRRTMRLPCTQKAGHVFKRLDQRTAADQAIVKLFSPKILPSVSLFYFISALLNLLLFHPFINLPISICCSSFRSPAPPVHSLYNITFVYHSLVHHTTSE